MIVVNVSIQAIEKLYQLRPVVTEEPLVIATIINQYANEKYLEDPLFFEELADQFEFTTSGLIVHGIRLNTEEFLITDIEEDV